MTERLGHGHSLDGKALIALRDSRAGVVVPVALLPWTTPSPLFRGRHSCPRGRVQRHLGPSLAHWDHQHKIL
jgi:hypothetical protein